VDVAAELVAGAVIFGDEFAAVTFEPRRRRSAGHLVEPVERVVGESRVLRSGGANQLVLGVVGEGGGAVEGQGDLGVVAQGAYLPSAPLHNNRLSFRCSQHPVLKAIFLTATERNDVAFREHEMEFVLRNYMQVRYFHVEQVVHSKSAGSVTWIVTEPISLCI
jgi:hypothetical protein